LFDVLCLLFKVFINLLDLLEKGECDFVKDSHYFINRRSHEVKQCVLRFNLISLYFYLQGFCVPPELSDEVCGEGATEFTDYEQAGLGEGEGVKNVSDEIEDEDQVRGEGGC